MRQEGAAKGKALPPATEYSEALSQRRARGLLGAGGTAAQGPMNLA